MNKVDLISDSLGVLSWKEKDRMDSLTKIFKHVTKNSRDAIGWYVHEKNRKKRGAIFLRFFSIVFGAVGGLLPMVSQIWVAADGRTLLPPVWSSIFFGAAAALVAMDKLFGLSSGWMRYIEAKLLIERKLKDYELAWEIEKTKWGEDSPTEEEMENLILLSKKFLDECDKIVMSETNTWIQEFQKNLKQIESSDRKLGVKAA